MGEHGGDAYTRTFGLTYGARFFCPGPFFWITYFYFYYFPLLHRVTTRGGFYFLFFSTSPRGTEIGVAMTARDDDDDGKMK